MTRTAGTRPRRTPPRPAPEIPPGTVASSVAARLDALEHGQRDLTKTVLYLAVAVFILAIVVISARDGA